MGGVASDGLVELRQEAVAHHAEIGRHGVGDDEARFAGPRELVDVTRREERIVRRLGEAQRKAEFADAAFRPEQLVGERRDAGGARHDVGQIVKPVDPRNLLNEVGLDGEIPPPRRNRERRGRLRPLCDGQLERRQNRDHLVVRDVKADERARPVEPQCDGRVGRPIVHIDDSLRDLRVRVFLQEVRGAARGQVGDALVHASDVARARLARQPQFRGRRLRGNGIEERAFEKNARRSRRDAGVFAAHDARDGLRMVRVANDEHRGVEFPLHAVKRDDGLALVRLADNDGAVFERPVVKGVQRLAELQHHVVRDVHGEVDRANATEFQPLRHPVGRGDVGRHLGDDTRRVAQTFFGALDADANLVPHGCRARRQRHVGHRQGAVKDGAELPRQPDDGKRVGAVPGDIHVEDGLRLLDVRDVADTRAHGRLRRELDDSRVPRADAQLLLAAAHAEALDAANLALLDLLRVALLVEEAGDGRADFRERRLEPQAHVGGAADDLERLRAVRHAAHVEVVGVGVRLTGDDLAHDDQLGERLAANGVDGLDLKTRARQTLGELGRGDVIDLDKVIQPRQG